MSETGPSSRTGIHVVWLRLSATIASVAFLNSTVTGVSRYLQRRASVIRVTSFRAGQHRSCELRVQVLQALGG